MLRDRNFWIGAGLGVAVMYFFGAKLQGGVSKAKAGRASSAG